MSSKPSTAPSPCTCIASLARERSTAPRGSCSSKSARAPRPRSCRDVCESGALHDITLRCMTAAKVVQGSLWARYARRGVSPRPPAVQHVSSPTGRAGGRDQTHRLPLFKRATTKSPGGKDGDIWLTSPDATGTARGTRARACRATVARSGSAAVFILPVRARSLLTCTCHARPHSACVERRTIGAGVRAGGSSTSRRRCDGGYSWWFEAPESVRAASSARPQKHFRRKRSERKIFHRIVRVEHGNPTRLFAHDEDRSKEGRRDFRTSDHEQTGASGFHRSSHTMRWKVSLLSLLVECLYAVATPRAARRRSRR